MLPARNPTLFYMDRQSTDRIFWAGYFVSQRAVWKTFRVERNCRQADYDMAITAKAELKLSSTLSNETSNRTFAPASIESIGRCAS